MDIEREIAELWTSGTAILYFVTVEEQRVTAICHRVAKQVDGKLAAWTNHRGLDPLDTEAKDPLAMLDALEQVPGPLMALLLDFHEHLKDPSVARKVRDLLPRFASEGRCLAIVAPHLELPESLAAEAAVVRLPLPDEQDLQMILKTICQGVELPEDTSHKLLMAARGLTESQSHRAFVRALRVDATLGPAAIEAVLTEKKRILAHDLGLEHIDTTSNPEEIGGLHTFKAWLSERALAFTPEAHKFGLTPPRGVMLLGVQGCGKSLSARYIAKFLGVPLLRLDLPRVLGTSAGSAEESLARALSAAEAIAPVALWVDEIEKGFAGSAPGKGGDSRASRLLGAFSTWLQERTGSVFMVATANDVSSIPPELLRRGRFDELFFVDLPDLESRTAILTLHLTRRGRDPSGLDILSLAQQCENYSGAELEQVVVGALHRAYSLGRDINASDLRRLAEDLVPLYKTYEEQIKALREWARGRARSAAREGAVVDLFRRVAS